jgi:Cytochrome c554 and c-prime
MRTIGLALAIALGAGSLAAAQPAMGRCATCHFANYLAVPGASHLSDWAGSAHARRGVGCEACHGGDPNTVVPAEAHRGVVAPRLAWSSVAPANLPATCGRCHANELTAFRRSAHYQALMRGTPNAPTCSTCHGAMTSRVPSPAALEARCASCHGPQSAGAAYPQRSRTLIAAVSGLQDDLQQARWMLAHGAGDARARALEVEAGQRLTAVADAWHRFDLDLAERRAVDARTSVDALLAALGVAPHKPAQ